MSNTMPSAALISNPPPKKISWVKQAYQRVTWIRVRYGQRVKPQVEQISNLQLSNEQVLQPRDEPIGHSFAFPLNKSGDMAEESSAKRK